MQHWKCYALPKGRKGRRHRTKLWRIRQQVKRRRKNRHKHHYCSETVLRLIGIIPELRGSVHVTPRRRIVIDLPEKLDFEDNYELTAAFFALLRRSARSPIKIKNLRFDRIKRISSAAALVLVSEVDRWKRNNSARMTADVITWDEDIYRLLTEMGYFDLLELVNPKKIETEGDSTFLPFLRGKVGAGAELAKDLRVEIEKIVEKKIQRESLFAGLSEAITNVSKHAYPKSLAPVRGYWWMSASYKKSEKRLVVIFYDHGAGIPKTLPHTKYFEKIKESFSSWSDGQKIKAAMELGRSSSGLKQRGKGLQDFLEFVNCQVKGQLKILSLKGGYEFHNESIEKTTDRCYDKKCSIGGTLIEWSVVLKER